MFKKPTFEDNIYMKLFFWAYLILILNVGLVLLNLPFFLTSLFMAFLPGNYWLFLLTMSLFGPGIISIFSCVDEFYETKDLNPIKKFIKGLKEFGVKGFLYFGISLVTALVSGMDILFFYHTPFAKVMIPFFILLMAFALSLSLNLMYFQIRNPKHSFKDIFRISFFYLLKKWYASVLNVILIVAMFALMIAKPQFGFLITPVIFLGIIYLNCHHLHPNEKEEEA